MYWVVCICSCFRLCLRCGVQLRGVFVNRGEWRWQYSDGKFCRIILVYFVGIGPKERANSVVFVSSLRDTCVVWVGLVMMDPSCCIVLYFVKVVRIFCRVSITDGWCIFKLGSDYCFVCLWFYSCGGLFEASSHPRLAAPEVVDRGLAESVLKPSIGVGTFKKKKFYLTPKFDLWHECCFNAGPLSTMPARH